MASGAEIHLEDLPPELLAKSGRARSRDGDWQSALHGWARQRLGDGQVALLDDALPAFERVMIQVALEHTAGRRQEAAKLLGWGRNTLTRKIKELHMEESTGPDAD